VQMKFYKHDFMFALCDFHDFVKWNLLFKSFKYLLNSVSIEFSSYLSKCYVGVVGT